MIKSEKENKEKKDFFTKIMIIQCVVCVIAVAALFALSRTNEDFFLNFRESYMKLMSTDFTFEDISDAFKNIEQYTPVITDKNEKSESVFSDDVSEENTASAEGGYDLDFTSLAALEGVSYDKIDIGFSIYSPLDAYNITSVFGYRLSPITGEPGIHTGLDMAAGYGTAIHAAASGSVIEASYDSGYGNYVKILHENNVVTLYGHCSYLCVEEGESVSKGEKIAEVGSTGASTGNHLHFEIRKDGIRLDPSYSLFDE